MTTKSYPRLYEVMSKPLNKRGHEFEREYRAKVLEWRSGGALVAT